jgi:cobalt-precorrin-5B (C1)-methyltransferase
MQRRIKRFDIMYDSVSGFEYPESWEKCCLDPKGLDLVERGLAVLVSDGSIRMRGFTTGTTATAAAKAAVISFNTEAVISSVSILTPIGLRIDVPVIAKDGIGRCRKYSGDYPGDVTAGLEFVAVAKKIETGINISFGDGIGRWERDTPRYKTGDPAVSPQVIKEIELGIREGLNNTGLNGIEILIYSPDGLKISKKTLNRKVGVIDGISILGTTGFVEPWDDHLEQSVNDRIAESERVILTTGRIGMRYARLLFPDYEVILAGSRLSGIISSLKKEIIICGLPALVLKYINPHFLEKTGYETVEEFMMNDAFIPTMNFSLKSYKGNNPNIRVVIVNREGKIIGDSE